ncbi:MAG: hypothetical protein B6U75_04975 [Desulfurococcales archaeon ex4484_217_1]|nr:MAG: hypothetical protein B6U75_04975 [Desulfurococcales archaeon ex4484_217_1]
MYVVDSSIFASIIVKDEFYHKARMFLKSNRKTDLITVDQAFIETANALWKHVYLLRRIPMDKYSTLRKIIIPLITNSVAKIYSSRDLLEDATDFAIDYGITVYDAVYVILALNNKCKLVSFDEKLHDALKMKNLDVVYTP